MAFLRVNEVWELDGITKPEDGMIEENLSISQNAIIVSTL